MSEDPDTRRLELLAARMRMRNRSARNNACRADRAGDPAAAAAWRRAADAHAQDGRDLAYVLGHLTRTTTSPAPTTESRG